MPCALSCNSPSVLCISTRKKIPGIVFVVVSYTVGRKSIFPASLPFLYWFRFLRHTWRMLMHYVSPRSFPTNHSWGEQSGIVRQRVACPRALFHKPASPRQTLNRWRGMKCLMRRNGSAFRFQPGLFLDFSVIQPFRQGVDTFWAVK